LLNIEKIALDELVNTWKEQIQATADASRITWDVELDDSVMVKADRKHLRNAWKNLVENALKYDNKDQPVKIKVCKNGETALISVEDHGPGIDKSDQEAIFAKFYRVNNSQASARGYGLGLSYTRQVIEMMNGHVSLSSIPGKGSTFTIELPVIS
jgi:signal transduction histidine kinase